MGYACPVCSDPQADAGHLANHLAFTAMLRADGHETWLDEHAAGWSEMGERELAAVVGELVEETEFPQLFEDTVGGLEEEAEPLEERSGALFDDSHASHGHDHDHASHGHGHRAGHDAHDDRPDASGVDTTGPMDPETAEILEEARDMTRRMREGSGDEGAEATDSDADGATDDDASGDRDDE